MWEETNANRMAKCVKVHISLETAQHTRVIEQTGD